MGVAALVPKKSSVQDPNTCVVACKECNMGLQNVSYSALYIHMATYKDIGEQSTDTLM